MQQAIECYNVRDQTIQLFGFSTGFIPNGMTVICVRLSRYQLLVNVSKNTGVNCVRHDRLSS